MKRKSLIFLGGIPLVAVIALSVARPFDAPLNTSSPASGQASAEKPAGAAQHEPKAPDATAFDAARAFALLQAQCDFGPRSMGSAGHDKCRDFLIEQLRPLVDEIDATQNWTQAIERGPGAGRSFKMTNILGLIRGTAGQGRAAKDVRPDLMLCAHWDTRPVADQDPDPANRQTPILGANDGASGVAVLLEIARVLHARRPTQTIVIALWDGEDLGEFFYGAKYFARMSRTPTYEKWRPQRAILLDMIGDRDLQVNRERNSISSAPELWDEVQQSAAVLGLDRYFDGPSLDVLDDHIPLNRAGIPTIDLIDFAYPLWHTVNDTPDKCSPDSLKVIGDVLLHFIAAAKTKTERV
jgi:glutaminyl-peptide cyclotransferase